MKLPSGAVYEAPEEFGDGYDRGFGKEYILQLPGITEGNVEDGLGEVLRNPNAIEQDGPHQIVIGDNPFGDGQLALRMIKGTIVGVDPAYEDPLGEQIRLPEHTIEKIKDRHPEIGQTNEEVVTTVGKILENADEIYIDDLGWRMYVTEVGDKIMFALVYKGKVITAYHPQKEASRERTIQYIKDQIEKYGFEKIYEDRKII